MQKIIITAPMFTVEITGDNERDLIKQAAFWQSIPVKCPQCDRPLVLNYRTPQTFVYYELRCTGTPSHSVNFGEAKVTHDLYFDQKKQWKTDQPNAIETDDDRTTPDPASTPATNRNDSNGNQNIGALKNRLIKLISDCKSAGIRSGLNPGDVGSLDEPAVNDAIGRLGELLKRERPA